MVSFCIIGEDGELQLLRYFSLFISLSTQQKEKKYRYHAKLRWNILVFDLMAKKKTTTKCVTIAPEFKNILQLTQISFPFAK